MMRTRFWTRRSAALRCRERSGHKQAARTFRVFSPVLRLARHRSVALRCTGRTAVRGTIGWSGVIASNLLVALAVILTPSSFAQTRREIPPAFGPFTNPAPSAFAESVSFASTQRLVGTYYFYWYNSETKEHIIDGDGSDALTTHPATLEDFSYKSVRWHKQQLNDMIAAGIDVVLPVFWGAPSEQSTRAHLHWSYAGLPPLVQAREELVREGKTPPRIGLFYDTSTLRYNAWGEHVDLTTDYGRQWFYATVRDFFSMIPPKHWAMIDGRAIVLLYSASFAKKHDQSVVDHTRAQFAKEFGGRGLYFVAQDSWRVKADDVCAWGGALGLKNPGVAALGPGYDHSAVPGRTPLIVNRAGGKFYEDQWLKFLRRRTNFVMVETWNEFHEGTDIAESKEYGRQYIELTRKYSDLFKQGWRPPRPTGKFSGAKSVSIVLGARNLENGLRQIENEDGQTAAKTLGGRDARAIQRSPSRGAYIYFTVDESFKFADAMELELEVEFFDGAPGTLSAEFDGSDPRAPFNGAYTRSADSVKLTGSQAWKTARVRLPQARLLNSQNRGADLRLVCEAPQLAVRGVTLHRASRNAQP